LASVFSLALSINNVSAANLVTNGSFEEGTFNGNYSWDRLTPGNTNLTGWTIGSVAVDWHNTAEFNWPHTGTYLMDLNIDGGGVTGTISQSFDTTPGKE
jgi:hypothetical protein